MELLALDVVSSPGGRKFTKSSQLHRRQVMVQTCEYCHKFARVEGIGSLSMVSMVTDHEAVQSGNEEGGRITQSLS